MIDILIGGAVAVLVVIAAASCRADRQMRRRIEENHAAREAARKAEDDPFEGRYRITPIVGGYRIESYGDRCTLFCGPYKGYGLVAEVQGSIEDARATVEHLSQPVEVIR